MQTSLKVVFRQNPDGAPANVRLSDGTCFVDPVFWNNATPEQKKMVLYHEEGHYELKTKNEFEADQYALSRFFSEGGRPRQAVLAVADTLPLNNTERKIRAHAVLHSAKLLDKEIKAMTTIPYTGEYDDLVSFLGLGKEAKANRSQKKQLKLEKREAKNYRIRSNADSKKLLAEQGINTSFGQQMKDGLGALSEVAGKFIPGVPGSSESEPGTTLMPAATSPGPSATTNTQGTKTTTPPAPDDKDDKILGISKGLFFGIIAVVVVVVIVVVIKAKK